jgi:hypothetical protein
MSLLAASNPVANSVLKFGTLELWNLGTLFTPIRAPDGHRALVASPGDVDAPRVAAHFAVLDEAPLHVRFDVNLQLLAAVRTDNEIFVGH